MSAQAEGSRGDETESRPLTFSSLPNQEGDGNSSGSERGTLASMAVSTALSPQPSPALASPPSRHRTASSMMPPPAANGADGYSHGRSGGGTEMDHGRSSAPRLSRKRAAPLRLISGSPPSDGGDVDQGDGHDNKYQNTNGSRPGVIDYDGSGTSNRDTICLCTPAPRVPRPRNAFILFRQCYQADVVAENPGLANPKISQIIGKMWKSLPSNIKNDWNELAEKEKERHRRQYPDYRYQPRRSGKGGSTPAVRSASVSGHGYGDIGGGNGTGTGEGGDPGRCPKCGGRYIATPRTPSTPRLASGSARLPNPPNSAFNVINTGDSRAPGFIHPLSSTTEVGPDSHRRGYPNSRPFTSDGHQREAGRRPLPQHRRSSIASADQEEMTADGDLHSGYHELPFPSEQKRRRFDGPGSSPARSIASGPADVSGSNAFLSYRPMMPQKQYQDMRTPTTPASGTWPGAAPPAPRLPANGQQTFTGGGRPISEAQHGRIPLPHQNSTPISPFSLPSAVIPHTSQGQHNFLSQTPIQGEFPAGPRRGYMGPPARLPPPGSLYSYYPPPPGSSALPTPSTAMAGLSVASVQPPPLVTPASSLDVSRSNNDNERGQWQSQTSLSDGSLKLPPLQTHILPTVQSPSRSDSSSGGGNGSGGNINDLADTPVIRAPSPARDKRGSDSNCSSASSNNLQDIRAFAVSPCVDRNSQASGIRAMVMSVPYLSKLEVLRRISPPQPVTPRRGPIISIEGHSPALITEVGRIVEKALTQSDECDLQIWSASSTRGVSAGRGREESEALKSEDADDNRMAIDEVGNISRPLKKKDRTDSGVGSSLGGVASSDHGSLESYLRFIMSWHGKSQEIIRHVTGVARRASSSASSSLASSAATPQPSLQTLSTGKAKSPAAPPSPASRDYSPASGPITPSSPATSSTSCDKSPALSSIQVAATAAPSQLLPAALITGGYSLSISDHYATAVPIEDSFPPIGHWEWMATQWRGIAGPDLVVYVDAKPPPAFMETPINTRIQEGVMVVYVPQKSGGGGGGSDDGAGARLVDDKTGRRLAFEVMEWVRTSSFYEA